MYKNFLIAFLFFYSLPAIAQKKKYTYTSSETTLNFSADSTWNYYRSERVCAVYTPAKGKDSAKVESSPFRMSFTIIENDDAGEENLLNKEPDGALRFALNVMQDGKKTGESTLTVSG